MGVVKVKVPTPGSKPIAAELADKLSSALICACNVATVCTANTTNAETSRKPRLLTVLAPQITT